MPTTEPRSGPAPSSDLAEEVKRLERALAFQTAETEAARADLLKASSKLRKADEKLRRLRDFEAMCDNAGLMLEVRWALAKRGLVIAPLEPTADMIETSQVTVTRHVSRMSGEEKHRRRLAAALRTCLPPARKDPSE